MIVVCGHRKTDFSLSNSGTTDDDGYIIRVTTDLTGRFIATASSEKSICILDAHSGDIVAQVPGTEDEKHLSSNCHAERLAFALTYEKVQQLFSNLPDLSCCHCLLFSSLSCRLLAHSKPITGLRFLPDGRHLVSTSADACIHVWRLANSLTEAIEKKARSLGKLWVILKL